MTHVWDAPFEEVLRAELPRLAPDSALQASDSLRAAGLDSMASVELIVRLEEALSVSIPDEELGPEAFATVGGLWSVVERARA
ncbi:acyl carrier protein [Peterkaempfera sp. SMS 1(5)a]|uniref:acyl carrier protein n=1 Tax=Peterkaempfera podocarpi TaxID=3232308 RepID=UPI00366B0005